MASAPPKLDSLPAEIIKRIASCSPCESVINLIKVNRRLYTACNDRAVFKEVIKNGNGSGIKESWNIDFISEGSPTSDYARFALADSKARKWMANQCPLTLFGNLFGDPVDPTNISDIVTWAPQLGALHHFFLSEIDIRELANRFQTVRCTETREIVTLGFILTLAILHQGALGSSKTDPSATFGILETTKRQMISGDSSIGMPSQNPMILACALLIYCRLNDSQIWPPSPSKIPFQSFMDLPLPFSETYPAISNLKGMTTRTFLEDGEWVGYYCYSVRWEHTRFDPPMRGIRFTVTGDNGDVMGLSATGTDNVGDFSLIGNVWPMGEVEMSKNYDLGVSWRWRARMTAVGIVGTWGELRYVHGMFWLWKRVWST